MLSIARQILAQRQKAGLTQAGLAARCGIAQPNIAAFERGIRRPSLSGLGRIAAGLGVEVAALLRVEEQGLTRFDFEKIALDLASGRTSPVLDASVWDDLKALFHPKLRALFPGPRLKPRLSATAAQRRIQARLGTEFLPRLNGRFSKLNLGAA